MGVFLTAKHFEFYSADRNGDGEFVISPYVPDENFKSTTWYQNYLTKDLGNGNCVAGIIRMASDDIEVDEDLVPTHEGGVFYDSQDDETLAAVAYQSKSSGELKWRVVSAHPVSQKLRAALQQ